MAEPIADLGVTEQQLTDAYIYVLGRCASGPAPCVLIPTSHATAESCRGTSHQELKLAIEARRQQ